MQFGDALKWPAVFGGRGFLLLSVTGCREWRQPVTLKLVELIDGVAEGAAFVGSLEIILTQVLEYGSVGEHVPDRGDYRMFDRDEGSHWTSPAGFNPRRRQESPINAGNP